MVDLDPKSLEAAETSLARVADPFTRHLLAFTLWERVKSGKWKVDDFAAAALDWLSTETDKTFLEDLGEILESSRPSRISVARLLEGDSRAKFRSSLHALARKKTESAKPGSDLQRIWFRLALRSLSNADANWALGLATKKTKISGLKIDPDLRWTIALAVARVKSIDPPVLEQFAKDDPSSEGQDRLLEVKAASPDLAGDFAALFTFGKTDPAIPTTKLIRAARAYLSYANPGRIRAWRPTFFASLETVTAKSDESYYRTFAQALFPALCTEDVSVETEGWIRAHPKAPSALRIALEKMAFNERWCAAIRAGREFPLWTAANKK
jgi:aminopeptidase N